MFARRHPFLFFGLVASGLFTVSVVALFLIVSVIVTAASGGAEIGGKDKVGVIKVEGAITESDHIVRALKKFGGKKHIKAVVLRVDSPGGGVGPSQEIAREVERLNKKKKVVVSMGSAAASGGYYISAPAEVIYANPGTITGSIGVIIGWANLEDLFKKIGFKPVVVKSGAHKDMISSSRELTKEEREMLDTMVQAVHGQFVGEVAKGRKMPEDKVRAFADGRILTGEEALKLGLVDKMGNFNDAIAHAGRLGGIEGEPEIEVAKDRNLDWLEYMLDSSIKRVAEEVRGGAALPEYVMDQGL
jgi:protease-4